MNHETTQLAELSATLTAHSADGEHLLLATLSANQIEGKVETPPAKVALVIDRSGSMQGSKLDIAKLAVARLIRSLSPLDQVALVVYDDSVDVISGLRAPSEALARSAEEIHSGGSTNLYGGWLAGAKLVGPGGRVVLLSDGLANVGKITSAAQLAQHAARSYEQYRVTTTTIGVGRDYDEALMAGMARHGGGAHYFAQTAEAIMEAFTQERFSIGQMALSHVSLRFQGVTKSLGHFWSGETKRAVLVLAKAEMGSKPPTLRYTVTATGETHTHELRLPAEFGVSDEATLEHLIEAGALLEERAISVRDSRSAGAAAEEIRELILRILAHPLADGELARSVRNRLEGSRRRLQDLERKYDEQQALVHRKRSMQTAHNLRERAKSWSSFEDESADIASFATHAMPPPSSGAVVVDPRAVRLATIQQWRQWKALPSRLEGSTLIVVLHNPRDGFLIEEISKSLKVHVRSEFRHVTEQEILDGLSELEAAGF